MINSTNRVLRKEAAKKKVDETRETRQKRPSDSPSDELMNRTRLADRRRIAMQMLISALWPGAALGGGGQSGRPPPPPPLRPKGGAAPPL